MYSGGHIIFYRQEENRMTLHFSFQREQEYNIYTNTTTQHLPGGPTKWGYPYLYFYTALLYGRELSIYCFPVGALPVCGDSGPVLDDFCCNMIWHIVTFPRCRLETSSQFHCLSLAELGYKGVIRRGAQVVEQASISETQSIICGSDGNFAIYCLCVSILRCGAIVLRIATSIITPHCIHTVIFPCIMQFQVCTVCSVVV